MDIKHAMDIKWRDNVVTLKYIKNIHNFASAFIFVLENELMTLPSPLLNFEIT